jgi:hypothetical protein
MFTIDIKLYKVAYVAMNSLAYVSMSLHSNHISAKKSREIFSHIKICPWKLYVQMLAVLVCPFVLFLLALVLSVLLRYTDSDYPFRIVKLFLAEI